MLFLIKGRFSPSLFKLQSGLSHTVSSYFTKFLTEDGKVRFNENVNV